jgi:addiction module RelE/StbE family toxin
MQILFHKDFRKRYKKLRRGEQQKTDDRIRLFETEMFHPLLNNHELHEPYEGCRSINITGDIRAVYEEIGSNAVHFIALGTRSELYE